MRSRIGPKKPSDTSVPAAAPMRPKPSGPSSICIIRCRSGSRGGRLPMQNE